MLREGSYAELVSGYDTESGDSPHSSEDSEDRPRRFDSMSSSDDSEKDVQHVRFVSGRGQNARAFLRDIELGVHAGGKHITHTHMMDTAISKCDKRFREKLNGWRQFGCPSAKLNGGVLDVKNTEPSTRKPWYATREVMVDKKLYSEPCDERFVDGKRPSWDEFGDAFVQAAEASGTKEGDQKKHYNKLKRMRQRHSGSMHCDDFFARLLLTGLVADGATPDQITDFRILELLIETLSKANSKGVKKSLGAKKDMHSQIKKAYGKGKLKNLQLMFDAVKAVDTSLQNEADQLSPPEARYWASEKKSKADRADDDSDDDVFAVDEDFDQRRNQTAGVTEREVLSLIHI